VGHEVSQRIKSLPLNLQISKITKAEATKSHEVGHEVSKGI